MRRPSTLLPLEPMIEACVVLLVRCSPFTRIIQEKVIAEMKAGIMSNKRIATKKSNLSLSRKYLSAAAALRM